MSFSRDINNFRLRVEEVGENIVRQSLFDLFTSIILQTPVDRGVLRNGWYVTFEQRSTQLPNRGAPTGNAPIERAREQLNNNYSFAVDTVYFTNNLAYGPRIEYDGHSAQAPQGMVRVNTARWNQIVEENIRRFRD